MNQSAKVNISREYQKTLFQDWDWQFIILFIVCIVLETLVVFFLSRRPVEEYSDREIARIQERFASFILDETKPQKRGMVSSDEGLSLPTDIEEEEVAESEGEGGGEGEGGAEGGEGGRQGIRSEEERAADRMAASEVRRQTREAISRTVSSKGILGLLTGTGSAASGEASSDLLAYSDVGTGPGRDLDEILNRVDALETGRGSGSGSGSSGGNQLSSIKGSRSGRRATIDDLVSDLETASGESFSRKGDLKVETPSDVIGRGSKSTHRSAEAIQEVLLGHVKAIRYCYERELKRLPSLKGKVTVRITVNPEGHVKHVEIMTSTLNNTRVERCIVSRIQLWKDFKPIEQGEGDVTFRQVYAFGY